MRGRSRRGERATGGRGAREAARRQRHAQRDDDERKTTKKTRREDTKKRKNHKKKHAQVLDIHGRQKQQKRTATFFEFCRATSGVLLCTDVAARGLDIPEVNWIVQFDPPV